MVVTRGMAKRSKLNIIDGKTSWDSGTRNQPLIPGIPDDVTTNSILPKLSCPIRRTCEVVSRAWLEALRNGKVYEARVLANSTETMFVHCVRTREPEALRFSLYSVEDDSVYPLPTMPGLPSSCKLMSFTYTSVKGRLYVFGEKSETTTPFFERRSGFKLFTYEYDLVRHRGWRQCASPQYVAKPRECAVMNDKIFVCDDGWYKTRSALYDPDADVWSPIMIINRIDRIYRSALPDTGLKEKIRFLGGAGYYQYEIPYDSDSDSDSDKPIEFIRSFKLDVKEVSSMAPLFSFPSGVRIESAAQEVKSDTEIEVMLIDGKFFKSTPQHIVAYDSHSNTWNPLHFEGPFEFTDDKFDIMAASTTCVVVAVAVVRIKNEIYSVVEQRHLWMEPPNVEPQLFLMKSKTFIQAMERQENSSSQQNVADSPWKQFNFAHGPWKQLKCDLPLSEAILRCPIQL